MKLITDTQGLAEACQRLARARYVTVDTEFMREVTFWPVLCLIQLAGDDCEFIVDPLAGEIDLTPFFDLMADEGVTKVFHAARQDIEIIHHLGGIIPRPVFDTQIAAMVCGFGDSIGYSNLVSKITRVEIDKTSQYTDWKERPLSERQLTYALGDVTHLRAVYEHLAGELERTGRSHWLNEEMATLTEPETYESHPENAWKRLKGRVRSARAKAILIEVAAWREKAAQSRDLPRNRILKDNAIYDIANQAPSDSGQLARLRTVSEGFAKSRRGAEILEVVARGRARDLTGLGAPRKRATLDPEAIAVVELLRVHLKATAARSGVAPKLLATTDDLERIALSDQADVPALRGWRRELFGASALALKHGELALAVRGGTVALIEVGPKAPQ